MPKKVQVLYITLLSVFYTYAQEQTFLHTELNWKTIETPHFLIHFHNGTEWTAKNVAAIAESIYIPITQMYSHEPDQKVSLFIRDHDDYSNGAAYFYDNRIEIWAPSLDFELRGTHPWLWDVVTHEFTHMVQIQTAMKYGRRVPAIYFQWLGYESERRTDVLYGFPNVLVSYPISGFVIPIWFAEGVAQYNHPNLNFDYWDSHRDMILRMYMLDGNPLTWEEMSVFGKTSLGNESSYNAGFSIVSYIAETYGVDKLSQISQSLGTINRITIDGAIEAVLGKTGQQLYDEWKSDRTRFYKEMIGEVLNNRREGENIEADGFGNFFPAFSPDGKTIAYISNKGHDYFGASSIYLYDLTTKTSKEIHKGVRSSLSFSPDGKYLFYSKISNANPHWSGFYDIYRYDINSEKEERLTFGARARYPKISNDGSKIVFVEGQDGTTNLAIFTTSSKGIKRITNFKNGEQIYTPVWSPYSSQIAIAYSIGYKRSVALINEDGSGFEIITEKDCDARDPYFSSDGKSLIYSADHNGIFNIYQYGLENREHKQITNVLGGAFLPTLNSKGDIAYAHYTSSGYKIALIKNDSIEATPIKLVSATRSIFHQSGGIYSNLPRLPDSLSISSRSYRNTFTSLSLIPLIRIDKYSKSGEFIDAIKPGLYFVSSEVLDKLMLFGGIAVNRKFERDLFFIGEYRDKLPIFYQLGLEPTLSLEGYNITRSLTVDNDIHYPYIIPLEVQFNLLEFDIRLKHPIFDEKKAIEAYYTISRYDAKYGSYTNPLIPQQIVPAFISTYLISHIWGLKFTHIGIQPSAESAINPTGRTVLLRYTFESNDFDPRYDFDSNTGSLVTIYNKFDFNRVEFRWDEHIPLFNSHTLTLSLKGGGIIEKEVDPFFNFYGGGFAGMKSYPYYGIGGNQMLTSTTTYRFPILKKINKQFLQLNLARLYGSVFADFGNAWTSKAPQLDKWKSGAGFELRLEAFSFYAYPTRIFFSGAYGFNKYSEELRMQTATQKITYGKEWRFYLGILFDFEFHDIARVGYK